MRSYALSKNQRIINKINAKQDFTYRNDNNNDRYVIGIKTLHKSKNPSLKFTDIYDLVNTALTEIDQDNKKTVGGWNDETNTYFVDLGQTTNDLTEALQLGKDNNQIAIWDSVEAEIIKV